MIEWIKSYVHLKIQNSVNSQEKKICGNFCTENLDFAQKKKHRIIKSATSLIVVSHAYRDFKILNFVFI